MKSDMGKDVTKCLTYQQIKEKHQRLLGFLQPMSLLEYKWEHASMDFIVRFPRVQSGVNTLWVIVNR